VLKSAQYVAALGYTWLVGGPWWIKESHDQQLKRVMKLIHYDDIIQLDYCSSGLFARVHLEGMRLGIEHKRVAAALLDLPLVLCCN
jgi:hypothetical protein